MTQTEKEAQLEEALLFEKLAEELSGLVDVPPKEVREVQEQVADLYRTAQRLRQEAA